MKKKILLFILFQYGLALHSSAWGVKDDSLRQQAKSIYGKEARIASFLLDNNHYSKIKLNDSLSSVILDNYIKALDPYKFYFLASDIELLKKRYNDKLDDLIKTEDIIPAYEIFDLYAKRFKEVFALTHDEFSVQSFDFQALDSYNVNRQKADWPKDPDARKDLWYHVVKSQALGDKLLNVSEEKIKSNLQKRYERSFKTFKLIKDEDIFNFYMNAIAEAYDPHTNYLSPEDSDVFKQNMSLSLEGVGLRLQSDNDYVKITDVISGGPADKSKKLFSGDVIMGVGQGNEGEIVNVQGWRLDEIVKMIKGPKGSLVRLRYVSAKNGGLKGIPEIIELKRDKINLEDLAAKKKIYAIPHNGKKKLVGVINLPSFYMDMDGQSKRSTTKDVKKLIEELKQQGIQALIIDLRDNGGGSLTEAINLTGLFIKNGPIVQVKSSNQKIEVLSDRDDGVAYDGPMAVMINRRSASASEIFAGAIQDYKRGVILGERSFGKGTVQTLVDLNRFFKDDKPLGILKFTYQKFYRISGGSTQIEGVKPDITFPSFLEDNQFTEGESPGALPWDVIAKASYKETKYVTKDLIEQLKSSFMQRTQNDEKYKKFLKEVSETKKDFADTEISLNEDFRRKEMEEIEKKKKALKQEIKEEVKETKNLVTNIEHVQDEYLRQTLFVLQEILEKSKDN